MLRWAVLAMFVSWPSACADRVDWAMHHQDMRSLSIGELTVPAKGVNPKLEASNLEVNRGDKTELLLTEPPAQGLRAEGLGKGSCHGHACPKTPMSCAMGHSRHMEACEAITGKSWRVALLL